MDCLSVRKNWRSMRAFESGWEAVAMEITEPSGKTETVKFDKAKQQERVELHTGYELTAVSLDEQYNYVALYQIQQYDE